MKFLIFLILVICSLSYGKTLLKNQGRAAPPDPSTSDTSVDSTTDSTSDSVTDTPTESTSDLTSDTSTDTPTDSTSDSTSDTISDTTTPVTTKPPVTPPSFTSCSSDSDCPSTSPYCDPSYKICQVCMTDFNCRSKARCNAACAVDNFGKRRCNTPVGLVRLACGHSEVCYISAGVCQPSCVPTGNLPSEAAVPCNDPRFNISVGNICDKSSGVCYGCVSNTDCSPSAAPTCGSTCNSNADYTQTCSIVTACTNTSKCVKNVTTSVYSCFTPNTSSASSIAISGVLLLLALGCVLF